MPHETLLKSARLTGTLYAEQLTTTHEILSHATSDDNHMPRLCIMSWPESPVDNELTLRHSGWYRAEPVNRPDSSPVSINRDNVVNISVQHDRCSVYDLELDPLTEDWLSSGDIDVISVKCDRRRSKHRWEHNPLIERALGHRNRVVRNIHRRKIRWCVVNRDSHPIILICDEVDDSRQEIEVVVIDRQVSLVRIIDENTGVSPVICQ